jgi:hypothetical protein
MTRIVTNALLFLFLVLVLGCGSLNNEKAVQTPKAPEPKPAPTSSTPVQPPVIERVSEQLLRAQVSPNRTSSCCKLALEQRFYAGSSMG